MKLAKDPFFYIMPGIAVFGLHQGFQNLFIDDRGLIIPWHPVTIAALCIGIVVVILSIAVKGRPRVKADYRVDAAGCVLCALGILTQIVPQETSLVMLLRLNQLASVAAGISMLVMAYRHLAKKAVHFLPYAISAVFWCLHMVLCYQSWSACPQIGLYIRDLFAAVTTTLYLYHRADRMVNGQEKKYLTALGRMAIFFCTAAISGIAPLLSAGTALWLCTDLSREV